MKTLTVEITKAEEEGFWYFGLVGKSFEVVDSHQEFYTLKEDIDRGPQSIHRHIFKNDCRVVDSTKPDLPTRLRALAEELESVLSLLDSNGWTISIDNYFIESLRGTAAELEK